METNTSSNTLHIDKILLDYFKKKRIRKTGLAHAMNVDYQNIFYCIKRKDMSVSKLIGFSHGLKHNFLLDIAMQLPGEYTTDAVFSTNDKEEIIRLKERIKILETENALLMKMKG